ncbi:MAG: hypothetical protein ACSHX6_03005 [Akkermansiaceae bacterium]
MALTIWNYRKGKANILFWVEFDWDSSREESPYTFWLAISLQVIGAIGFIAWGIIDTLYFS